MKSIVLAEKPSVAREIARILKCQKKAKGYFEGKQYIVTWALGHLVTLAEPQDYDNRYREWKLQDLPMMPDKMKLKVIRKSSFQFKTITSLMNRKDAKELIIATDAGREGELVARWIMIKAGWRKPFTRLWISSQTDEALLSGFANLKPGQAYNRLFSAAVCRAEADWLIGLNVTRALTCKFNAQLTAGRVQTPTLAMIVQREKEIKAFVPKDYWTIIADFGDFSGLWKGKSGSMRIFDQPMAHKILEKVKGQEGVITGVRTEEISEPPPLAYDLTELQRDANRRYSFSAQKTLSVLQGLYERHKLVTYPRTDSRYITTDMIATLPKRLNSIAVGPYAQLVQSLMQKKLNVGKRFANNAKVTDHHAIIPTEQPLNINSLENDERRLYDLIARRFITVLSPPYRYLQTSIVTEVAGEKFFSKGKIVKDMGWRTITTAVHLDKQKDSDELPDQTISQQKKGEKKIIKNCRAKKSQTQPPPRYTEATLLTAMESPGKFIEDEELRESIKQGGLGTPATRAEIIEKLLNSYYVERHGKTLIPTSKGFQLIDLVPEDLKSPELTAKWELRLSNIAQGKESNQGFIADIRKSASILVKSVKEDTSVYKADNLTQTPCPMCGKKMLLVRGKKGKMLVCSDGRCGYQQPEKQADSFEASMRRSKSESRINRKMIDRFSDHKKKAKPSSGSLGDLFEKALGKK